MYGGVLTQGAYCPAGLMTQGLWCPVGVGVAEAPGSVYTETSEVLVEAVVRAAVLEQFAAVAEVVTEDVASGRVVLTWDVAAEVVEEDSIVGVESDDRMEGAAELEEPGVVVSETTTDGVVAGTMAEVGEVHTVLCEVAVADEDPDEVLEVTVHEEEP